MLGSQRGLFAMPREVSYFNAAGWSRGNRTYLLAAPLDEAELRKLL